MAIIPPDQKFHTLDPSTPTPERGSTRTNSMHEIYTMQDIADSIGGGAGSFEAYLQSPITVASKLVQFNGFDSALGLPIVRPSNQNPGVDEADDRYGLVNLASPGVVDVLVSGPNRISFAVPNGTVPTEGIDLFSGPAGVSYRDLQEAENLCIGFTIGNFTLLNSYPGFYDVYEGDVFLKMPWLGAHFIDTTSYFESQRVYTNKYSPIVPNPMVAGEIVKFEPIALGTTGTPTVIRWDPASGHTVSDIAGVISTGSNITCLRGNIEIPSANINGPAVAVGDIIYSDATTPYQLTTDPTSGIQIGIVQGWNSILGWVRIDVNPVKGGGGATTGEKLDFTVRSSAYTGATGEHEGIDLKIGGAASVTAGLAYYWNGNWNASDAVLPASGDGLMAMATDTGVGVNMMQKGIIQLAANPAGAVAGSVLYFESGTPGTLTATAPSASGNIVRVAGHAIDAAGLVYFDPSEDWLEIV